MSKQTDDIDQKIADMIAVLEEFEERFELIRGNFNALVAPVAHVAPPEGEVIEKLHYKVTEVARLINCSRRHVHTLMMAGKLKYWKDGSISKISAAELERYIEEGYERANN